jgi:adenylosuccinate synthase
MTAYQELYNQIYRQGKLFGLDKPLKKNPLIAANKRPHSVAICGGAFGDEGKGRVTDEFTARFLKKHKQVIHYRDNGGANAGHTVHVGQTKLALHQLGSGILLEKATVISGKGMVIHPQDLVAEINLVRSTTGQDIPATLILDEMAVLSLDTHRAFESALKDTVSGSQGSTGRGIAPAYADIIYRHPLRFRDLATRSWKQPFTGHYRLYQKLLQGLGFKLAGMKVARLEGEIESVGTLNTFLKRLEKARKVLKPYIKPCHQLLEKAWHQSTPFVFEKAQGLGLDHRLGVYPDVTASDCTFEGIRASTEGIVDPTQIALKAAVIKATYTSSVGKRILPSTMKGKLVDRIRQDAHEYGATTGRPRDIHHLDLPLLSFLMKAGQVDHLIPTHLDIVYPDMPIKICVAYTMEGNEVPYRPDQKYLNTIKPKFLDLPTWNQAQVLQAKKPADLPKPALQFLTFLQQTLGTKVVMATTGPKRHQTISWL